MKCFEKKWWKTVFSTGLIIITFLMASCSSSGGDDPLTNNGSSGNSGSSDDNVGDSFGQARTISLSSSGTGSYSSRLDSSSDMDYYRISVSTGGSYTLSTTGSTDTRGRLYNSGQTSIEGDDDSGSGNNFSITRNLTTGTYYIRVSGYNGATGAYTIVISRNSSNGSGDYSGSEGSDVGGRGDVSWTLTWSYSGSEESEGPDIDLWVQSPSGYTVSGVNRSSGNLALDVDDRGAFGSGDGGGPERIYFSSDMTLGTYEYGVRWYQGDSGTVRYTIRLYHGSTLVGEDSGNLNAPSSTPGSYIKVKDTILQ